MVGVGGKFGGERREECIIHEERLREKDRETDGERVGESLTCLLSISWL